MCRFIAYQGEPIVLKALLFGPQHSLINQSARAMETVTTLNGDGFGVGWYNRDIDPEPGVFKSIQPAWNDSNLLNISHKIQSSNFFAHVRAATMGGVSRLNCHPFHHQQYVFMHNGTIAGFNKIKRNLRRELSNDIYEKIEGQTDSEHFFALIIDYLSRRPALSLSEALRAAMRNLQEIQAREGVDDLTLLNIVLGDGEQTLTARYTSHPERESNTLYYYQGSPAAVCSPDNPDSNHNKKAIILASEKLSDGVTWLEVPVNHLMLIAKNQLLTIEAL